jgi:predicted ATPase
LLNHLLLRNFKLFERLSLPLAELTVLSGNNSSGKSSVLQAVALLEQAYLRDDRITAIELNGELVELGSGNEIYFSEGLTSTIDVRLEDESTSTDWKMHFESEGDVLNLADGPIERPSLLPKSFQYLRADRISPQQVFPRSSHMVMDRRFLGPRGEYTADFILRHKDERVEKQRQRIATDGDALKLDEAINQWLEPISAGVGVKVSPVSGLDYVKLGFSYRRAGDVAENARRSTHVGFGLTCVLPVITACLSARKGDLLLIENPEAHLHPEGQAVLGDLLSKTAADGVQVLVETHSDHVLNAIRLAVKCKTLTPIQVAFHFFGRLASGKVAHDQPEIDAGGRLDQWPSGFFDQWEKALRALLRDA